MNTPEWITLWVTLGVAALVGGLYFYIRHWRPKHTKARGKNSGGNRAVAAARRFAKSNGFAFICPARLGREDKSAALDAVVVGYFGVLGVKAYGYNGEVYGDGNAKTWVQVFEGKRTEFQNPLVEAAADVRVVRDALMADKLRQVPVEVLCVFTDPKVQLAIPKSLDIYTPKTLSAQLKKDKYLADTGLDIPKVQAAIQAAEFTDYS